MSEPPNCPCCNNPWAQPADSFCFSCEVCVADDKGTTGVDPSNMDNSVSPADNFFLYANGAWMEKNPIPAEYPGWNTFFALHDANLSRLRTLLEECKPPAAGSVATTPAEKVAAFWSSAIDEAAIEAAGLTPLQPALAVCDGAGADKTAAVAALHARFGANVFFSVGEGPDDKASEWTLVQMGQAGLGLPDRDYYFDADKEDKRALYATQLNLTKIVASICGEPKFILRCANVVTGTSSTWRARCACSAIRRRRRARARRR